MTRIRFLFAVALVVALVALVTLSSNAAAYSKQCIECQKRCVSVEDHGKRFQCLKACGRHIGCQRRHRFMAESLLSDDFVMPTKFKRPGYCKALTEGCMGTVRYHCRRCNSQCTLVNDPFSKEKCEKKCAVRCEALKKAASSAKVKTLSDHVPFNTKKRCRGRGRNRKIVA